MPGYPPRHVYAACRRELLTYLLSGLWTIWELNEVLDSTTPCAVSDVVPRTKEILLLK